MQHYKNTVLLAALAFAGSALAQPAAPSSRSPAIGQRPAATAPVAPAPALQPCSSVVVDSPSLVTLGKSSVIRLDVPVVRMVVGGLGSNSTAAPTAVVDRSRPPAGSPAAAAAAAAQALGGTAAPGAGAAVYDGVGSVDITLLSPTELFFLGKRAGAMNVVLQSADGRCFVRDIIVTVDPGTLQAKLTELLPEETEIKVRGAENALVLTGRVSDAMKLDDVMSLATSYGDGKRVVNLLRVSSPQQVMLEVKIAEVSKTLLDRLGASIGLTRVASSGLNTYSLISNFLSNGGGLLQALRLGRAAINIDAEKDDGLVRVLAEPNIMAISGQSASFLSGGKIFIPVAQDAAGARPTITLEEKEFGIGLKFTPTVLDRTRVNLKLVSEVSDLTQTGSPFTTVGGVTSVLPSFTVRRADTTVQLNDGQSFVIAGLIKNNVTETIKRFPGLGEVPVMGALFRSTEFQNDRTELLFVITPRLVKPLTTAIALPTDNHIVPTRAEVMLNGAVESGAAPATMPQQ
ncbi:MAG: type II and III secretion system protein family protein [Pseudomonadota bacterium]